MHTLVTVLIFYEAVNGYSVMALETAVSVFNHTCTATKQNNLFPSNVLALC